MKSATPRILSINDGSSSIKFVLLETGKVHPKDVAGQEHGDDPVWGAADKGKIGVNLVNWRHELEQKWAALRFGEMKIETDSAQHIFEVQVYLGDLDPEAVRAELYADGASSSAPEQVKMERVWQLVGANQRLRLSRRSACNTVCIGLYGATHSATRRHGGSARILADFVAAMIRSTD